MLEEHIDQVEPMLPHDVHNIQLLYRASQHSFSVDRFHQCCDGTNNTLTLAKTEFGRVLGAFCGVAWQSPPRWEYVQDPSRSTFLFSTHRSLKGLKFVAVKPKFMIGMHR